MTQFVEYHQSDAIEVVPGASVRITFNFQRGGPVPFALKGVHGFRVLTVQQGTLNLVRPHSHIASAPPGQLELENGEPTHPAVPVQVELFNPGDDPLSTASVSLLCRDDA